MGYRKERIKEESNNRRLNYDKRRSKKFLPIIKAFAESKIIQYKYDTGWENIKNPAFNGLPTEYRIKLKPKYRPFKNQEECWKEMLKHQPFGWIKNKNGY